MVKIIQDIWILKSEGVVLFKRVFNEKMDAQLFGGFMSALNALAGQLDKSGLSNFELGDKKYAIIKNSDLVFIANFNKNSKPKKAEEELKEVVNKFFNTFQFDEITSWKGDLSYFERFKDVISESLETVEDKLTDALW